MSVEHQLAATRLKQVHSGSAPDREVLDTIREAGGSLLSQYLLTNPSVKLDPGLLQRTQARLKSGELTETVFDEVSVCLEERGSLSGEIERSSAK